MSQCHILGGRPGPHQSPGRVSPVARPSGWVAQTRSLPDATTCARSGAAFVGASPQARAPPGPT